MNKNRKTVIAGNWKMNKTAPRQSALIEELQAPLPKDAAATWSCACRIRPLCRAAR